MHKDVYPGLKVVQDHKMTDTDAGDVIGHSRYFDSAFFNIMTRRQDCRPVRAIFKVLDDKVFCIKINASIL